MIIQEWVELLQRMDADWKVLSPQQWIQKWPAGPFHALYVAYNTMRIRGVRPEGIADTLKQVELHYRHAVLPYLHSFQRPLPGLMPPTTAYKLMEAFPTASAILAGAFAGYVVAAAMTPERKWLFEQLIDAPGLLLAQERFETLENVKIESTNADLETMHGYGYGVEGDLGIKLRLRPTDKAKVPSLSIRLPVRPPLRTMPIVYIFYKLSDPQSPQTFGAALNFMYLRKTAVSGFISHNTWIPAKHWLFTDRPDYLLPAPGLLRVAEDGWNNGAWNLDIPTMNYDELVIANHDFHVPHMPVYTGQPGTLIENELTIWWHPDSDSVQDLSLSNILIWNIGPELPPGRPLFGIYPLGPIAEPQK